MRTTASSGEICCGKHLDVLAPARGSIASASGSPKRGSNTRATCLCTTNTKSRRDTKPDIQKNTGTTKGCMDFAHAQDLCIVEVGGTLCLGDG